ncbi:MAG: type II toxin-antitoxin system VapC family toxin [Prochlorococcaceae cyanobacterium]
MILLDTNVISALMQSRPDPGVVGWLDDQNAREVWLPSVVVFELRYGVDLLPVGRRRRSLQQGLDQLLEQLVQERQARGRPVDLRDTLIAGIALARGAQLATRHARHFSDTTIGLINPFAD